MAKVRCENCGFEFDAEMGSDDSMFEVYRCDECDRLLRAERTENMDEVLSEPCGCGGRYWKGRPPKCRNCRSPNVVEIRRTY